MGLLHRRRAAVEGTRRPGGQWQSLGALEPCVSACGGSGRLRWQYAQLSSAPSPSRAVSDPTGLEKGASLER